MGSTGDVPIRVVAAGDKTFRCAVANLLAASENLVLVGEADDIPSLRLAMHVASSQVILLDANHFGADTTEAVRQVGAEAPHRRIFIVADDESDSLVLDALRMGAHGHAVSNEDVWRILPEALQTVASGGTCISPRMAGHILDEIAHIRQSPRKRRRTPSR